MVKKAFMKDFELLAQEILSKEEIEEEKQSARVEHRLMQDIASNIKMAMEEQNIGFNDLVKNLHTSPSQVSKILRGDANITLHSLVKLCIVLNLNPSVNFEIKE